MATALSNWCVEAQCELSSRRANVKNPNAKLLWEFEQREDVRSLLHESKEDVIGPLLPMHFLDFGDALLIANAASAWSGFEFAYEIIGRHEGRSIDDFTSIRFRRTGERGFRLAQREEWLAFAPADWHERSAEFSCLHGNLADDGKSCYDGYRLLAPVASYRPTDDGIFDLWGNAYEWGEPAASEFEADGWWVEDEFDKDTVRVPLLGRGFRDDHFESAIRHAVSYATKPRSPLQGFSVYGLGMRLVIEPDQRGHCPTLAIPWSDR